MPFKTRHFKSILFFMIQLRIYLQYFKASQVREISRFNRDQLIRLQVSSKQKIITQIFYQKGINYLLTLLLNPSKCFRAPDSAGDHCSRLRGLCSCIHPGNSIDLLYNSDAPTNTACNCCRCNLIVCYYCCCCCCE